MRARFPLSAAVFGLSGLVLSGLVLSGCQGFQQGARETPGAVVNIFPDAPPAGKAIGIVYNFPSSDALKPHPPPAFFVRASGSLARDGQTLEIPIGLSRVLYEGELVVVVASEARRVTPEQARRCILGYSCGMDGTPQSLDASGEFDRIGSLAGKSADGIAPVGPRLVKEIDLSSAVMKLRVNGRVVETTKLAQMVWDPARIISEVSKTVTLDRGDIIFCGARRPVPQMRAGDTVEVEITGIGILKNTVAEAMTEN